VVNYDAAAVPTARRFDFNGVLNDTVPGFTGVRGTNLYNATLGYGWKSKVGEFERATTSLPASMTADQKSLYRDGASLNGMVGTFQVSASANTSYTARYYIGDSARIWQGLSISVEDANSPGGYTPWVPLNTVSNRYWSYTATGKNNGDSVWEIRIVAANVWVLNALDVVAGTTANLPPSVLTGSPQLAGFPVTSGTAPVLMESELAPIVTEAVRRWEATGLTPAQRAELAAVSVRIDDLNGAGRLGEHVPGTITIDDDAGGKGWFVDATPMDDSEFTGTAGSPQMSAVSGAAAGRVDLLTMVMHELGHELGLDDLDPTNSPAELMTGTLVPGLRRLPASVPDSVLSMEAPTLTTPALQYLWLPESVTQVATGTESVPTVRQSASVEATWTESELLGVAVDDRLWSLVGGLADEPTDDLTLGGVWIA
jgi:hypothetical protein